MTYFFKKFAMFLCRDILASQQITDDEVSDDTAEEMMGRYFTQEQLVDNKIYLLLPRQTMSVS